MRSKVAALALSSAVLIVSTGCRCQPVRQYDQSTRDDRAERKAERERLVKAQRSQYKDLQSQLASLKRQIENDVHIHEMSMDAEDPLNRREDPVALARIIDTAKTLQEKSASALAVDREVFRYVKGSNRALREYKKFADTTLDTFEQRPNDDIDVGSASGSSGEVIDVPPLPDTSNP